MRTVVSLHAISFGECSKHMGLHRMTDTLPPRCRRLMHFLPHTQLNIHSSMTLDHIKGSSSQVTECVCEEEARIIFKENLQKISPFPIYTNGWFICSRISIFVQYSLSCSLELLFLPILRDTMKTLNIPTNCVGNYYLRPKEMCRNSSACVFNTLGESGSKV